MSHRSAVYPGLTLSCCVVLAVLTSCVTPKPISPELAQCMARPDRFVPADSSTVLDTCTQLMWMVQDYRNIEGIAPNRWRVAMAWVTQMNQQRYGGHRDWRVPTFEEYAAIYQAKKPNRSYRGKSVGYSEAFAKDGGEWYWEKEVATRGTGHIHDIYLFNFRTGKRGQRRIQVEAHPSVQEHTTGSIRLVRGPIATPISPAVK